eukprot:COSAG03_NODE_62_length_15480_cov_14.902412_5_plen_54_part_00
MCWRIVHLLLSLLEHILPSRRHTICLVEHDSSLQVGCHDHLDVQVAEDKLREE